MNLFLLGVLLLSVVHTVEPAAFADEFHLNAGAILGLSGDKAIEGNSIKNGLELGLSTLPSEIRKKITLHYEDNLYLPGQSVTALRKLSTDLSLCFVINSSASTGYAIVDLTERQGITLFSISSAAALTRNRPRTFLFWVTPERLSSLAISHLKEVGASRIARFNALSEGRLYVRDTFDKMSQNSFEILQDENINPGERDFRPFLTKLRAIKSVDTILVNLFFGQIGTFAKQVRNQGLSQNLLGFEFMGDRGEIESSDGALKGARYIGAFEGSPEFRQNLLQKYPATALRGAANGYDIALIMGEIVKKEILCNSIPEFLRNQKEFSGALGKYQLLDDGRFDLPAEIRVVN